MNANGNIKYIIHRITFMESIEFHINYLNFAVLFMFDIYLLLGIYFVKFAFRCSSTFVTYSDVIKSIEPCYSRGKLLSILLIEGCAC